jgi:serine protease Do
MKYQRKFSGFTVVILMAIALLSTGVYSAIASKTTSEEQPVVRMIPDSFRDLAEKVRPGVVNIRTVKTVQGGGRVFRHFFGNPFRGPKNPHENAPGPFSDRGPSRDFKQQSLGSGFIIDPDGYIVTNNHVIEGADKIKVKLATGQEYEAEVVGRDPKTDLALIKIDPSTDLVPLKIGDSDAQQVGTWVVAVGSPFGLEQTVTAGIVSAKGRVIGAGPYDNFIQTDASINPGNSGGPLINMNGEVIGINTAIIASGQGIGFAIPVNLAGKIIAQLKDEGEVTRAWLGVGIQDVTGELADYYGLKDQEGVLVTQVFEGDPADQAGIKPNDVIIAVDGKKMSSSRELSRTIAGSPVGEDIPVSVVRDGKQKTIRVTLAKRQDAEAPAPKALSKNDTLGLKLAELEPELARRLGLPEDEKGVLVTQVESGSKAAQAGIEQADLIKEINRTPVYSLKDYNKQMKSVKSGDTVRLLVKRPNAGFVAVKITV